MWPDVIWASAQKYPKIQKQKVKGHQTSDSELFWFTVNDQTLSITNLSWHEDMHEEYFQNKSLRPAV